MNKKGIALILSFIVIVVLAILGGAIVSRSVFESRYAQRYLESTQAFWLAEAGISQALVAMEKNNWIPVDIGWTVLGSGEYSVEKIAIIDPKIDVPKIWAHGFIPSHMSCRAERIIELSMPLYGGVLYVVGDIDISGDSYSIDGNVVYAGQANPPLDPKPDNITGTVTYDPSIKQLDELKFDQLRLLSQSQGNYYDLTRIEEVKKGKDSFPVAFWNSPGVPNVAFLEGPLILKGGDNVHGFFVVGGEAIYDTTMGGTVSVDGCIYTRGDFIVLGGGGAMNVTGGIWVGQDATLRGGITLEYNADYMSGVQDLGMSKTKPKILWRDTQNPYN